MKRAIAIAPVMVLLALVSGYRSFAAPQVGKSAPAPTASKALPVSKPTSACPASAAAAINPAKATAQQRKIFSLLDDKDLAEAKAFVESDANSLNVGDSDGLTPLAEIANAQNFTAHVGSGLQGTLEDKTATPTVPKVAEMLISKGANVNTQDDHGGTPLIWAAPVPTV